MSGYTSIKHHKSISVEALCAHVFASCLKQMAMVWIAYEWSRAEARAKQETSPLSANTKIAAAKQKNPGWRIT